MAMIAGYLMIDEDTLDSLMTLDNEALTKKLSELEESGKFDNIDIDKIWDALHFCLTGVSASEPIEGNALSEAVVGVHFFNIEDEEASFITCTENDELPALITALEQVDLNQLFDNFSPEQLDKNDIYPKGVGSTGKEELVSEMTTALNDVLNFYKKALSKEYHVIVSIL